MNRGKVTDKLLFTALYVAAAVMAVWGARLVTNAALDFRYYRDFLLPWQTALLALRHQAPDAPAYQKEAPMDYMNALVTHMRLHGVTFPSSNTGHPFIYDLNKFGERSRRILMVFDRGRMVLYGLPPTTFDRLDGIIDGRPDPDRGDFTGRWSADQVSRIAQWKL